MELETEASWLMCHTMGEFFSATTKLEVILPVWSRAELSTGQDRTGHRSSSTERHQAQSPEEEQEAAGMHTLRERDVSNPWQAFRRALWRRARRSFIMIDKYSDIEM